MSGDVSRVWAHLNETLISPAAQKIDFWANRMHVDGLGFRAVFQALFTADITIDIDKAFVDSRQAAALYDANTDQYKVSDYRFGSLLPEQATLLHESVHAIGDLRDMYWITNGETEVAAYVAEMLFYRYVKGSSLSALATRAGISLGDDPIREQADKIGDAIANKPGAVISALDFTDLMQLVARSPTYRGVSMAGRAGMNGLSRLKASA